MNGVNPGQVPAPGPAGGQPPPRPPAAGRRDIEEAYHDLRQLPLFEGIPDEHLWHLLNAGGMRREVLERDRFVADPESLARGEVSVYLVVRGQIAVGVFDREVLARRRAEQDRVDQMTEEQKRELSLLKPPPLAREARKNLASFQAGDIFNSQALATGAAGDVAFFTTAPAIIVRLVHRVVAELAVGYPFFEARLRRAIEIGRDRLKNIAGVKQEIMDFFIRHGVSVSGEMVRVRQLDSCIDCKLCEIACEQRYGRSRLTLGGYQLGMLDFVFTCRTCTDQRCIDPCEYDSIKFDRELREVVINEASCVGCTLCSQACPYDAIEMVDVEDPHNPTYAPKFKARLSHEGALEFGAGKPRLARARRIANKCDHCMTYGEQACVSACPTGSLIEISAYDLFNERSPVARRAAVEGYNRDVKVDHREILPTDPFTKGVGVRNAGMAKVKRGRIFPVLLWGIAVAAFLLGLAEILLRFYEPTSSLQYVIYREAGIEPAVAQAKVKYRPGSDLAIYCGYVGAGLILTSVLYPIFRRFKSFRKIVSNTMWFDLHMMAGTMGPAFICLHAMYRPEGSLVPILKLDNWVAGAFWSMAIVFISGVIGRYLYTQVPDLLNGRELEELDHERAFTRLRTQYPQATHIAERLLANHKARADHIGARAGMIRSFLWIMMEDFKRPFRAISRRRMFRRTGVPRKVARDLRDRTARMLLLHRRQVLAPRAQLLLHSWKKVHVPFTFIMAGIAAVHIYYGFKQIL